MSQVINRLVRLETKADAEKKSGMLVYEAPVEMTDEVAEAFLRSEVDEIPGLVIRINNYGGTLPGPRLVNYSHARSGRTQEEWVDRLTSQGGA